MTILAPDRQSTWSPSWLIAMTGAQSKAWAQSDFIQQDFIQRGVPTTVPARFASHDLAAGGLQYQGRILDEPVVEQGFFDSFWGVTKVTTVRFRLANADHALDLYHTRDVRGTTLTITRYDEVTATSVVEFTGKIAMTALAEDALEVEAVAPDLSAFEQSVPHGTVTADTFPKAVNVGAVIPVVFGNVTSHRCPYVNDDTGANQYDYLVGRGALAITAVYRDGPGGTLHLVDGGEYTVETTRYAGLTTLRFTTRQVNFSNAFHVIYADVTGLAAERNFARAVKTLLSDTTYGLSQTVNAASFTTAEAALPASLFCDGAMTEQRAASDVLRDLLMVRGMRLGMNASGEWTLTVDTQQADVRMTIQDGTGDGERNLIAVTAPRRRPSLQDSIRNYTLRFRWDPPRGDYRLQVTRAVHGGLGRDIVLLHPFLRDVTAADTVVHYLAQREIWGNETVSVDVTQEARQAVPGDRVTLTYAPLNFSAQAMEVRDVRKGLDRIGLDLALWSANFYTYTAGFIPTDPTVPTPARLPSAPGTTTKSSDGTYQAGDGTTLAYVIVNVPAVPSDAVSLAILVRINGVTPWQTAGILTTGATTFRIDGLTPGQSYEVGAQAFNAAGSSAVTGAFDDPYLAPGDTTAPSAPSAIAVRQSGAKVVEVDFTFTEPTDWGALNLYRSTTTSTGAAVKVDTKKAKSFHDQDLVYGQTYAYWGSAVDLSLNESGLSAGEKVTIVQVNTPDVTQNAITASAAVRTDANIAISTSTAALTTVASLTLTVGSSEDVFLWTTARIQHNGTIGVRMWLYACTCELREISSRPVATCSDTVGLELDTPSSSGSYSYSLRAADASIGTTCSQADLRRLFALVRRR